MRLKPITETVVVVACLQGERPKYLGKDRTHGRYVTKLALSEACRFEDEAEALEALTGYNTAQGWNRDPAWRAYRVTTKASFEEVALAPA